MSEKKTKSKDTNHNNTPSTLDTVIRLRKEVETLMNMVGNKKREYKVTQSKSTSLQDYIGTLVQSDAFKK